MSNLENMIKDQAYKVQVRAWTMYDWANSAFATTILAAILPIYFSQVAGATLPSPAVATSYWSFGLSISLFLIAILAPILGTISDIVRGKKRFLAFFAGIGILGTALLVLIDTGDWVFASILAIIGRIGFNGANSFYDALLPHVAHPSDRDRVSTLGYAMGYLGGGILLAINIVMLQYIPGTWGARLSFLSVAVWWAVFSIPLFRNVPEPPTATTRLSPIDNVISASFRRLWGTLKDIRQYRQLFTFLIAFLIYNDGIGTIIGVAAIYGTELGFGSTELVLALLLVQFVGIPYSLIFGRLPNGNDRQRGFYLTFIIFNIIALPLTGLVGANLLPDAVTGAPQQPFLDMDGAVGQGLYNSQNPAILYQGVWETIEPPKGVTESQSEIMYFISQDANARIDLTYNGQNVQMLYGQGPDYGIWSVYLDGQPFIDPDTNLPMVINGYNRNPRFEIRQTVLVNYAGKHTLSLVNTGGKDPVSQGNKFSLASIEILPPIRVSSLGTIIVLIAVVELIGLVIAWFIGQKLLSGIAAKMNTKRSVLLALGVYAVIAIWGFFLNSVIEFWLLAWMVAVVQGGSQALSRSLYSAMSPASKSGEFFGFFGIMEKFSAIIGPLLFGLAGAIFGSSRPAVLSLVILFIAGGFILTKVDVNTGRKVAQDEDEKMAQTRQPG